MQAYSGAPTAVVTTLDLGDARKREQLDAQLDEIAAAAVGLELSATRLEQTMLGGGGDVPETGAPVPVGYVDITLLRYAGILQTLRQANGAVERLNEAFRETDVTPPACVR